MHTQSAIVDIVRIAKDTDKCSHLLVQAAGYIVKNGVVAKNAIFADDNLLADIWVCLKPSSSMQH